MNERRSRLKFGRKCNNIHTFGLLISFDYIFYHKFIVHKFAFCIFAYLFLFNSNCVLITRTYCIEINVVFRSSVQILSKIKLKANFIEVNEIMICMNWFSMSNILTFLKHNIWQWVFNAAECITSQSSASPRWFGCSNERVCSTGTSGCFWGSPIL